jgi:hypothetical protein
VACGASHTTAAQFSNKFVDFCIEGFGFERAPVTKEAQMDDVAGARRGMIEIHWRGRCAYEHLGEAILALPQEQRQKFTIDDVRVVMMKAW